MRVVLHYKKSRRGKASKTKPMHLPNTITLNTESGIPISIKYRESVPGVDDSYEKPVVVLTGRLSDGYERTHARGNLSTSPLTEFAMMEFNDIYQAQQFTLACRTLRNMGQTGMGARYPIANIIRHALTAPEAENFGFSLEELSGAEVTRESIPHSYIQRQPLSLANLPSDSPAVTTNLERPDTGFLSPEDLPQ